jgi:hypothetical protein
LDAAALLGLFIVVKALEMPISSVREKLIIYNRFSGPMMVFRCCLFFLRVCFKSWLGFENNESLMGMLFVRTSNTV